MEEYYIIQDSRRGLGKPPLLLIDRRLYNGSFWTYDRSKAYRCTHEKAIEVKSKLKYNQVRIIKCSEYEELVNHITENQQQFNPDSMFENMQNAFNGMFGKVEAGMCRLTMNGNIAVKCSNGYKSYNVSKGTLTNVTNFCFNVGDEMFFVIPTNKVEVGDIILVGGKPKCVTKADKKIIEVIDYENSEVRQVVPERHVFMGSTYFYGKIVSMFGNSFKKGKGIGNVIKMMMFSQMMGSGAGNNNGGGMGNIGQMMAMSMFMGGKDSNPFEGMFDFNLDMDTDEEDSDEKETKPEEE